MTYIPENLVKSDGVNIDFTTAADTVLFTPERDFVLTGICQKATALDSPSYGGSVSVTTGTPVYGTIVSYYYYTGANQVGYVYTASYFGSSGNYFVPAGTPIILSVTNPDSGVAVEGTLYCLGFYTS